MAQRVSIPRARIIGRKVKKSLINPGKIRFIGCSDVLPLIAFLKENEKTRGLRVKYHPESKTQIARETVEEVLRRVESLVGDIDVKVLEGAIGDTSSLGNMFEDSSKAGEFARGDADGDEVESVAVGAAPVPTAPVLTPPSPVVPPQPPSLDDIGNADEALGVSASPAPADSSAENAINHQPESSGMEAKAPVAAESADAALSGADPAAADQPAADDELPSDLIADLGAAGDGGEVGGDVI